jgi:hypothetical protein
MVKSFFFCCCPNCGCIEWVETIKTYREPTEERVNELDRTGEMKYPWKMDIYVYTKFFEMKIIEKRFYEKKKWFNEKYEDLICFNCEKNLAPIPFIDIDKKQRIDIFNMTSKERIMFAKNYKIVKFIESSK